MLGRRIGGGVAAGLAVLSISACHSSGTHPQSFSPSPSAPGSPGVSLSTSPTSSPATSSTRTRPPEIATPTVVPAAQGAVDAYIGFYNAMNAADRNPTGADIAEINAFLTGKAHSLFDGVVASQARAGVAYRGTPEVPRIRVGTIFSPTFVVLTSCPLASPTDPFVQYYVKTGKPVVTPTPSVPPPYKRTISMQKINGKWKVADLLVDSSKTCTA